MKKIFVAAFMLLVTAVSCFAEVPFADEDSTYQFEWACTVPFGISNYPEETRSLFYGNDWLYSEHSYFVLIIDGYNKVDYVVCFDCFSDAYDFVLGFKNIHGQVYRTSQDYSGYILGSCSMYYPSLDTFLKDGFQVRYYIYGVD